MTYERKQKNHKLGICRNKLFNYLSSVGVRPYGNIVEFGHGFRMWGVNNLNENRLYYSDLKVIAVWRGKYDGWQSIPKEVHDGISTNKLVQTYEKDEGYDYEYKPKIKRRGPRFEIKVTTNGKTTIYSSAIECAKSVGFHRDTVYRRLASGKEIEGMTFEKVFQ